MMVKCFGKEFEFSNPTITIGSVSFDVRKAEEWDKESKITHEGEIARLYLNILGWPESTKTDSATGETHIIPARVGIDLASATYEDIWTYLNTTGEKMPESIKELMRKSMKLKDVKKFKNEANLVTSPFKNEYTLIDNEVQSIETLGNCGGGQLGKVRLDGSSDRIPRLMV